MVEQMIDRDFGDLVRSARDRKQLSQQGLADACGLSRGSIMHIEQGNQRIFLDQALKIALVLEIPLAAIGSLFETKIFQVRMAEQPEPIQRLINEAVTECIK